MEILFLGTGAAEGTPAMFCDCEHCNKIKKLGEREFRSRSQVLIDGELMIDFPPDSYCHALKYNLRLAKIKNILITHSHMDHFYAHDFILRGYKYAYNYDGVLNIYGNSEVCAVFGECTKRELKDEVKPNLNMVEIKPYSEINVGDYKVYALPAVHSKTEDALLFYIEKSGKSYLHFYDTGIVTDEVFEFLRNKGAKVDVVCFDCTFLDRLSVKGTRHMCIEDNMLVKEKLLKLGIFDNNTKIVISHFSHNNDPTRAHLKKIEKKYGVIAAYDGLKLKI